MERLVAFFKMILMRGRAATAIDDREGGVTKKTSVLAPLRGLSLDLRVARRLVVKHVGLTVVVIVAVCSLATIGPVRRALRIQPVEALRAE